MEIFEIVSLVAAFGALFVSVCSAWHSNKVTLGSSYFSTLSAVYSDFLQCVTNFVYNGSTHERDALSAVVFRIRLLGSDKTTAMSEDIYKYVLD